MRLSQCSDENSLLKAVINSNTIASTTLLALAACEVALVAGVPVADLGAVVVEADVYMI